MNNRLSWVTKLAATTALLGATTSFAQTSTPVRSPVPAKPQAAPMPAAFANIQQLCQLRERELIGINEQVRARNQAAGAARDQAEREKILAPMQNLISNMKETEGSWYRMDCARMLYGAR